MVHIDNGELHSLDEFVHMSIDGKQMTHMYMYIYMHMYVSQMHNEMQVKIEGNSNTGCLVV